ncbi:MAG TPA: iron-sulfur cluster assembly scaffold protein [Steroidobacteraceae bacterium]|nr:iron-sulfur cluster assembly scaffold protein [Steroidobacteraceae bacterium]
MSVDPRYSPEVLRRLRETPGAGDAPAGFAVAHGQAGDREHGAEVSLQFVVVDGRVRSGHFRVFGCPHLIAAASWVTERLRGASREEVAAWDWHEAVSALAVPPGKFGRLLTLQDAVRSAGGNWPVADGSTV